MDKKAVSEPAQIARGLSLGGSLSPILGYEKQYMGGLTNPNITWSDTTSNAQQYSGTNLVAMLNQQSAK